MASFDDLDAPQYSTFDDFDQEEPEQYFEVDHENPLFGNDIVPETEPTDPSIDDNFYSPMEKNSPQLKVSATSRDNMLQLRTRNIKRSSSCADVLISSPTESFDKMCLNEDKQGAKRQNNNKDKYEYGKLTKGNVGSQSKSRWCSQESLIRLAAPKKIYSSTGNLAHSSQEYVSVAEAVRKFHERTPNRYHSQNKNQSAPKNAIPIKLKATIPLSPRLLTKKRVKTNGQIMSHEEKLLLEFQNEQKFRIKAHPINKKILQPMKAMHVDKKPTTVPAPFNLTKIEDKKLVASPKKEKFHFHAKPVPKSIVEPSKLPKKQEQKATIPITPTFIKKIPKASPVKKEIEKTVTQPLRKTRPEPFSFEKRDMNLMKKKEEFIKKVVEEEKKAREFHARPIPKPIASMISKQKQKSQNGSACSLNQNNNSRDEHEEHFKARPPTVLYQKPFEPKRGEHPLTEIQPFNFNSEMRAKEREKFEQKKREQEELAVMLLKEDEKERLRREEEEIRRIREETKFKAHPIRNFKGVVVQPSGKVTEPISPIFLSGKSKKNKENEVKQ